MMTEKTNNEIKNALYFFLDKKNTIIDRPSADPMRDSQGN